MARRPLPEYVDTVIVGGGPASLILSYILHGHIPYYVGKHYDDLLHSRLSKKPDLLNICPETYAHFSSSLRYSTQALPLNTLLDTLIRPNADTETNPESCIQWKHEPDRAISHVVLTAGKGPGGQWVDNPVEASEDIGSLSYSEMLSLPGYSYAEHFFKTHHKPLPDFERPSRSDVAAYFTAYPHAVGLTDAIFTSVNVGHISRTKGGFVISSHGIRCKHLVLATGIFSLNIAPYAELTPLVPLRNEQEPILVVGSGFSAADVIISAPERRKIIHLFKWAPETRPSPLRGCHPQAYPEYAGVYRQMKLAAISSERSSLTSPPAQKRKVSPVFSQRDWASTYEGLPNAQVIQVLQKGQDSAVVQIQLQSGRAVERKIGQLAYVVGRRGSLDYLSQPLRREVISPSCEAVTSDGLISGRTLRAKVEHSFQVAPCVFVVGSLAGDSLVRHAFGGCVSVAGCIMGGECRGPASRNDEQAKFNASSSPIAANAVSHEDLHIDRRETLQI
ncbi:uncharacterized protein PV09_03989 [Verruconis gallopava]|uniref:FAD/NAD(P)-binding domain-containing protein n=1 Tax=Verruconis gallopava TaxID=253628 RepID=A0A0D2B0A0_9PEZI|nr:uncharacterized protein PV09_03989 [Verruconis gallopava]KIW04804.1 hypothetical protein PV09_03989 [Verruconis gallopava]